MDPMDPEEIARDWPEAVTFARAIRAVFGDGVRLVHAVNRAGAELGRDPAIGYGPSPDKAPFTEPDNPGRRARRRV